MGSHKNTKIVELKTMQYNYILMMLHYNTVLKGKYSFINCYNKVYE